MLWQGRCIVHHTNRTAGWAAGSRLGASALWGCPCACITLFAYVHAVIGSWWSTDTQHAGTAHSTACHGSLQQLIFLLFSLIHYLAFLFYCYYLLFAAAIGVSSTLDDHLNSCHSDL
jgi:hypothetical protein